MSATSARIDTSDVDLVQAVDYLCKLFGQVMTAAIAGVDDARMVEAWSRGSPIESAVSRRSLQTAYQVAKLLRQVESEESVQLWFMGMNPDLDDRAPAQVLREDPARVLDAAYAFVVHG